MLAGLSGERIEVGGGYGDNEGEGLGDAFEVADL